MKWIAALLLFLGVSALAGNYSVTISWDASPDPDLLGYAVYYGDSNRTYTTTIDVDNITAATITNLSSSMTYYFAVTYYTWDGYESPFSNELPYTTQPRLSLGIHTCVNLPGVWSTNLAVPITNWQSTNFCFVLPGATDQSRFFRFASDIMLPSLNPKLGTTTNQP